MLYVYYVTVAAWFTGDGDYLPAISNQIKLLNIKYFDIELNQIKLIKW